MSEKLPYPSYFALKTGIRYSWLLRNSVILSFFLAVFFIAPTVTGSDGDRERPAEKLVPAGEEQLLMFFEPGQVTITSSARRPQALARASSAMYVITAEDIRQAGVTKLADLFRLVPGMEIAHVKGSSIAISARGFAKPANPRMQVLLDGRPLYDPYRGGVDLVIHPIFLENIERIEVIRGSAGVTWGVNAMNGVINIITKKSADTQGRFGYGGFGNRALQEGYIRLGLTDGPLAWRGTAGAFHDTGFGGNHGDDVTDYHQSFMSTGRADLKLADDTELIFSGGHRFSTMPGASQTDIQKHSMQYMNLLWQRKLANDSLLQLRWSENFYKRRAITFDLQTREDMLEIQHNFTRDAHSIVWGADYTRDNYDTATGPNHTQTDAADPDSFTNDQVSGFIEDEIALAKNLWLTVGTRLYYGELARYDWAGRTALVWEAAPKHFFRAAISKSFRRPLLAEEFVHRVVDGSVTRSGNESLANEKLIAYELGYRGLLRKNLELNIEGFINKHSNLIGLKSNKYESVLDTTTYGIETAIDFRPYDWWLVRGFHVYEHQTDENRLNATNIDVKVYTVPQHKVGLTNRFYLDDSTTINTQLFWSDAFFDRKAPATRNMIEPYFRFDIRLAKKIWNDSAELAFGVTNLTEHFHYEGSSDLSEVPRQFYFQFFYKF